ncbi:MAG: Gfo/Idh/MocA family oxidoreductase [Anaerolineae bacterium]
MSSTLSFALVGCGDAGTEMWQGISAASPAELVMLMDENPQLLDDLRQVYAVPATTNMEDVLRNVGVDAVYISAPMEERVSLGIRAAEAGKHVFVEHPVARDLADVDALMAACEDHDVRLGVALGAQVDAGAAMARGMIRGEFLGRVIAVRVHALLEGTLSRRPSLGRDAGHGTLLASLMEQLNTVRWVVGSEVMGVSARCGPRLEETEDGSIVLGAVLNYANEAVGVLQGGWNLPGEGHEDVSGPRIYGTKGQLILAREPLAYFVEAPEGSASRSWHPLHFSGPLGDKEQMVERFATAVLNGRKPPVTGADARRALEIIEAIRRSAKSGSPQTLPLQE